MIHRTFLILCFTSFEGQTKKLEFVATPKNSTLRGIMRPILAILNVVLSVCCSFILLKRWFRSFSCTIGSPFWCPGSLTKLLLLPEWCTYIHLYVLKLLISGFFIHTTAIRKLHHFLYSPSHIFASNEQRNVSKRFGCTTTPHSFAVAAFSCPFQVHFFRPQKRSPKIISSKPTEKKVWKWKDFFSVVLKKKICN